MPSITAAHLPISPAAQQPISPPARHDKPGLAVRLKPQAPGAGEARPGSPAAAAAPRDQLGRPSSGSAGADPAGDTVDTGINEWIQSRKPGAAACRRRQHQKASYEAAAAARVEAELHDRRHTAAQAPIRPATPSNGHQ